MGFYRDEEAARIAAIDALPDFRLRPDRRCKREGCKSVWGKGPHVVNGVPKVYCKYCPDRVYLCAPSKEELGWAKGREVSRPDLPPGMRERIMELDGARCFLCGRDASSPRLTFDVAHVGSVAEMRASGASDDEINSEHNLFWCCMECNQNRRPVDASYHPKMFLRIIQRRATRNQ